MIKIKIGDFRLGEKEKEVIKKILDSERISEGFYVKAFEERWAKFIGTKYSILTNSGTSAIIVGLKALEYNSLIKPKTKIITTPISYIATTNAIVTSNYEPVFVDVSDTTFCITPEKIKEYLEGIEDISDYSLILLVHLMGYACDMEKINKIAKKYNLLVFEDSSQAHGTEIDNKKVGSLSLLSSFSFYIAHNIQAGELGAINTSNLEIYKLIKQLKANGRICDCQLCNRSTGKCNKINNFPDQDIDPRFFHTVIGYNFKTMEFPAALAFSQLDSIKLIIKKRQENVKYLNEALSKYSDFLQLPVYKRTVSYLAYPLVIKKPHIISRKKLRKELEKMGVETRPLFGSIPTQQPAYSYLKEKYKNKLPIADLLGENAFYIGCHQYLNQNDLDYVIKCFGEILR